MKTLPKSTEKTVTELFWQWFWLFVAYSTTSGRKLIVLLSIFTNSILFWLEMADPDALPTENPCSKQLLFSLFEQFSFLNIAKFTLFQSWRLKRKEAQARKQTYVQLNYYKLHYTVCYYISGFLQLRQDKKVWFQLVYSSHNALCNQGKSTFYDKRNWVKGCQTRSLLLLSFFCLSDPFWNDLTVRRDEWVTG